MNCFHYVPENDIKVEILGWTMSSSIYISSDCLSVLSPLWSLLSERFWVFSLTVWETFLPVYTSSISYINPSSVISIVFLSIVQCFFIIYHCVLFIMFVNLYIITYLVTFNSSSVNIYFVNQVNMFPYIYHFNIICVSFLVIIIFSYSLSFIFFLYYKLSCILYHDSILYSLYHLIFIFSRNILKLLGIYIKQFFSLTSLTFFL